MGYDRDEIFAEYQSDIKELDRLGLIFDSDPRKMSGNGQAQNVDSDDADLPDKAKT
jgi:capsid protein